MPVQVWIQTQKENVQKLKLVLEESGQLGKLQKVEPGQQQGYMILPTNTYLDEETSNEAGYFRILSDLRLNGDFEYAAIEIVFIPTPSPGPGSREPKHGPIQEVISEWLQALPELTMWNTSATRSDLLESSPRRWSIYEPMLLLPSGSFQTATWKALLESTDETHLTSLWKGILHAIWKKEGGNKLTHLAINSGIPSKQSLPNLQEQETDPTTSLSPPPKAANNNILRSPSGLTCLHGSFGPSPSPTHPAHHPSEADFLAAFWVSTKQNNIWQTWAPRHTMFSRGNITEKARILAFHDPLGGITTTTITMATAATAAAAAEAAEAAEAAGTAASAISRRRQELTRPERATATALDLYAGIGYFAFSYAAAGFGRVVCWELNPWSVEGLRRGCALNGWSSRVVHGAELLGLETQEALRGGERVVVFEEGNERAVERMEAVRKWEQEGEGEGERRVLGGEVVHVNCGLLPISEASWESAWRVLSKSRGAWLHLHENVGVEDVESRRGEIERRVRRWASEDVALCFVDVEHVELVKTFAPGVWHCVFDVHVQPARINGI